MQSNLREDKCKKAKNLTRAYNALKESNRQQSTITQVSDQVIENRSGQFNQLLMSRLKHINYINDLVTNVRVSNVMKVDLLQCNQVR